MRRTCARSMRTELTCLAERVTRQTQAKRIISAALPDHDQMCLCPSAPVRQTEGAPARLSVHRKKHVSLALSFSTVRASRAKPDILAAITKSAVRWRRASSLMRRSASASVSPSGDGGSAAERMGDARGSVESGDGCCIVLSAAIRAYRRKRVCQRLQWFPDLVATGQCPRMPFAHDAVVQDDRWCAQWVKLPSLQESEYTCVYDLRAKADLALSTDKSALVRAEGHAQQLPDYWTQYRIR